MLITTLARLIAKLPLWNQLFERLRCFEQLNIRVFLAPPFEDKATCVESYIVSELERTHRVTSTQLHCGVNILRGGNSWKQDGEIFSRYFYLFSPYISVIFFQSHPKPFLQNCRKLLKMTYKMLKILWNFPQHTSFQHFDSLRQIWYQQPVHNKPGGIRTLHGYFSQLLTECCQGWKCFGRCVRCFHYLFSV